MASYEINAQMFLGNIIAEAREVGQALYEFSDRLEEIEKKYSQNGRDNNSCNGRDNISIKKPATRKHPTKKILCLETNVIYENVAKASEKTGINSSNIWQVCRGMRKTAGGYHWSYV